MKENLRVLKPYLRGLPLIIIAMIISVLLAKVYLNYTTPMYESTAKLKLEELDEGVPSVNLFKELEVFSSANKIMAEIEVLKSQTLLEKVIDELDFNVVIYRVGKIKSVELYKNSPFILKYFNLSEDAFDKAFDLYILNNQQYELILPNKKKIKGELGDILNTTYGTFVISLNDYYIESNPGLKVVDHYRYSVNSPQKTFQNINKNLNITPIEKDVPVLRITYKNSNPEKASEIVNKVAQTYIAEYIEMKYRSAHMTVEFLDGQINNTLKKISNSENEIQSYRDKRRITNIIQETETDLRKVSEMKIQQTNLKMSLQAIKELESYVKNPKSNFLDLAPNFEAFTDLLSTEIIKKIKDLQSQKKDLLLIYTHNDERIKVIDYKIDDLKRYLIESITNTRRNLDSKYKNLKGDISEAEQAFIGVPEKERVLNDLNREFNIYQQTYNFLNEKKIEAEIAAAAKMAFHKIISPGEVPLDPVSPNRTIIIIVSAILGMFASVLFIFIVHQLKAKVNDVHTIETNSTIPIALLTPKLKREDDKMKHFLKEAIQLEVKGLVKPNSIITISSFRLIAGSVYNALYLAKAFVKQERKVLLLDVADALELNPNSDTNEYFMYHEIEIRNLTNPRYNAFTKDKMNDLFQDLRSKYDVIIVINEPLDIETKAKSIMSLSDVNLIVLDARLSPKKRIFETELMKEEYNFPEMYFVLNRYNYNPSLLKEFNFYIKDKSFFKFIGLNKLLNRYVK
jgi:uncharacterized protein involved in exopolysaccharide biosynthesis